MEATPMKLVGAISTAVLALTLGAAVPAYAQEEQRDKQEEPKAKPAQQDEKKSPPDKSAKQEEKTPPQDKNARQQEKTSQANDKNSKQEAKTKPQPPTEGAKPEQQAQGRGGNGGGRIPDDRFKANFGQQHTFHVSQADNSSHRFQYGGYAFGIVDPWPSNWLYTQDVFVVDIDGVYYLCNPMYPGVNIALSVTL
jgi:hypothetical protein